MIETRKKLGDDTYDGQNVTITKEGHSYTIYIAFILYTIKANIYIYIQCMYTHTHTRYDGMLAHYYHNRSGLLVLVSKVKESRGGILGDLSSGKEGVCV